MKLKNLSLVYGAALVIAVSVTAYGQEAAPAAQTTAAPAAAQAGRAGGAARAQQAAPYMESPTAYQGVGPYGCTGCAADSTRGAGNQALAANGGPAPQQPGGGRRGGGAAPAAAGGGQAAGANAAAGQQEAPRRVGPAQNVPNTKPYDLLLKGGHVIDDKNHIDKVTDVGIKDGKIAVVGDNLKADDAAKAVDVTGLYVIPGMIDLHMHVYASTGERGSYAGDESIWPDGFTLRTGVTTGVDAGSSGWRNFEDFKEHIIDRSRTRIVAELNIVGAGMRGGRYENNLEDMDGEITGYMAKRYPGVVVGVKSAHYTGPEWKPYIEAVKAGTIANIPVMVDYGANRVERPMYDLVTKYLRPGDIYTHTFSDLRGEQDPKTLKASAGLVDGRKHGVYFDVGTGGGSFRFRTAVPLIAGGFKPDSISTDLHIGSMNSSTKDMLNVMSKFMAMGETLQEVVAQATWHPAREIKLEQLGNLSPGSPADVAVLSLQKGNFGFTDMDNMKMMGNSKLTCEMTLRNGIILYDLNGTSMDVWNKPTTTDRTLAGHWTSFRPTPPLPNQLTPEVK